MVDSVQILLFCYQYHTVSSIAVGEEEALSITQLNHDDVRIKTNKMEELLRLRLWFVQVALYYDEIANNLRGYLAVTLPGSKNESMNMRIMLFDLETFV